MIKLLSALTPLSKKDKEFKQKLKNILGFHPTNLALYKQAFRHSSSSSEINEHQQSNERLEFLGDAILGAVVAEYLFKLFPKKDEGFLTQMRSRIVNGQNLFALSKKFGFDTLLNSRLTKKERLSSSAYGDAFEAFIGAVFIDKGFEKTKKFILNNIIKVHLDMTELLQNDTDYKSQFQIMMQRQKKQFEYTILKEEHNGREKTYSIQLSIEGVEQAVFEHKSKKVAEQRVAQIVLEKLQKLSEN
ncbi:MAG: ribonuclease III [Bacteroidetes bacterium]|nr:ribonuclease III [Bacteroidota bacterium]